MEASFSFSFLVMLLFYFRFFFFNKIFFFVLLIFLIFCFLRNFLKKKKKDCFSFFPPFFGSCFLRVLYFINVGEWFSEFHIRSWVFCPPDFACRG